MKNRNLLLICASGITTGLLVRSIENNIEKEKLPVHVFSAPSIVAQQIIKDEAVDAILIGPHISHELDRLEDLLNYEGIPYRLMDEESYRLLNGTEIFEQGKQLLGLN